MICSRAFVIERLFICVCLHRACFNIYTVMLQMHDFESWPFVYPMPDCSGSQIPYWQREFMAWGDNIQVYWPTSRGEISKNNFYKCPPCLKIWFHDQNGHQNFWPSISFIYFGKSLLIRHLITHVSFVQSLEQSKTLSLATFGAKIFCSHVRYF